MSTSTGYVAVPRCPVVFDGTNYIEFVGFMRIHMRGIRLSGVLSSKVPCPPIRFLLWLLLRRRHRFLLPMLIKLRRMQLSLQMTLPSMLMCAGFDL